MIVDMLLAIGRFVDRLLGNRATSGRWSWPPLEDGGGPARIAAPTAGLLTGRQADGLVIPPLGASPWEPGRGYIAYYPDPEPRLSAQEADELAAHDAEMRAAAPPSSWPDHPTHVGIIRCDSTVDEADLHREEARQRVAEAFDVPEQLMPKWCAVHQGWADTPSGVTVVSEADAHTWCCASCLARHYVVGHLEAWPEEAATS